MSLADEIHKPVRRHFKTDKVSVPHIDHTWTADLMIMPKNMKEDNDNIENYLVVIDVFSKYAWVKPLKDKSSSTVAKAFNEIFQESNRKPKKLWTDRGGEFTGLIDNSSDNPPTQFQCKHCKFYAKNQSGLTQHLTRHCPVLFPEKAKEDKTKLGKDILLYHTEGRNKAVIAERFVKTIKEKIWKYMTNNATTRVINALPQLVNEYNNTVHTTINMTPVEGSKKENEKDIYNEVYKEETKTEKDIEKEVKKIDIEKDDRVRIARIKEEGAKGYLPNWSDEVFRVKEVNKTDNPITFILQDAKNHIIKGKFYKQEIQKTDYPMTEDMGDNKPRLKVNAMKGIAAVSKEALRQKLKKQRAAIKKKQIKQTGSGYDNLDYIFNNLPNTSLSNVDLEKVCHNLPGWRGVFPRDKLPEKPLHPLDCGILNLDDSTGPGTHWVCWHRNKKTKNYFDSYGFDPPTELINYLKSPINVATDDIQDPNTVICGHLCIFVLHNLSKGIDLQPILNYLNSLKE